METIKKALLWFEQNGFECYEDDETIYLVVNYFNIQVSTSEVLYRAEIWESSNLNRLELIEWLCANDSNGIYRDEDSIREGIDILTYEGAYAIYLNQLEG